MGQGNEQAAEWGETDRTAHGEVLGRVFDRSANAMLVADDQRHYTAANDAACRLLETSKKRLIGMRVDDFTAPELRDRVESLWREFIVSGTQAGIYELLLPDGRRRRVEYSATANIEPGLHLSIFVYPTLGTEELEAPARLDDKLLTTREQEVLELVMLGSTTHEIAQRLHIAPETARTHVKNVIGKLGARNRAHAVAVALQNRRLRFDI
jgi:PAS domain S-box-containing protein